MVVVLQIIFWICSFLLVYVYGLYPVFLIVLNRIKRPPEPIFASQLPKISLIVAAYNEEKTIEKRIQNCLNVDYPEDLIQIIIASDGSTDMTNEIVAGFANQGVVLHRYSQRRGKVSVLNDTVPQAQHDIIVFSDATTVFEKDALKKLVRCFQDPQVGGVCGELKFINAMESRTGELEGIYWRLETLLRRLEGHRGSHLGATGAIYAIRKNLFIPCPEDTIIEDFMIPMKVLEQGYYFVYDEEAQAIEEAAKSIIQEKQRRIRIGAGDFQALFRLLPMLNPKRGFTALAFWSHKVLRWFAPFFLIGAFATNAFLLANAWYVFIFILQCLFYAMAFVGQMLSWSGWHIRIFSICYYFVSMNLALLLGFVRYLTGRQNVAWERVER